MIDDILPIGSEDAAIADVNEALRNIVFAAPSREIIDRVNELELAKRNNATVFAQMQKEIEELRRHVDMIERALNIVDPRFGPDEWWSRQ